MTRLTPHVFRHSYATLAMENGIELADLQALIGHSEPSTTLVYASVSEERKRQVYKKYHVQYVVQNGRLFVYGGDRDNKNS